MHPLFENLSITLRLYHNLLRSVARSVATDCAKKVNSIDRQRCLKLVPTRPPSMISKVMGIKLIQLSSREGGKKQRC